MTTFEVIQRVHSLYSKGTPSDDSRLSNGYVYNKLVSLRARLITSQVKQKQKLSQWVYQTLNCVELIPAPIHECSCVPIKGCSILRSKYQLPKILTDMNRHIIQSVTTVDGSQVFDESTFEVQKYKKGNRFTSTIPDFYIRNGFIYLTVNKALELISVTALFADPYEVYKFKNTNCISTIETQENDTENPIDKQLSVGKCITFIDKDFPLDNDMIDTMIKMASDELVILFSQLNEDKVNNTSDDSSPVRMPRGSSTYLNE